MSSPAVPDPPETVWSRFPLDPRRSGDLRAGDADRETARDILAEAYARGQLSHDEYSQRLDGALQAHHLGQLVPLLNDVAIQPGPPTARPPRRRPASPAPGWLGGLAVPPSGVIRTALFVVGVTNLVWVWTSITSGTLIYYWPMWPALGMAIMVLSTMLFGKSERDRELRREQRELRREDRDERRELE